MEYKKALDDYTKAIQKKNLQLDKLNPLVREMPRTKERADLLQKIKAAKNIPQEAGAVKAKLATEHIEQVKAELEFEEINRAFDAVAHKTSPAKLAEDATHHDTIAYNKAIQSKIRQIDELYKSVKTMPQTTKNQALVRQIEEAKAAAKAQAEAQATSAVAAATKAAAAKAAKIVELDAIVKVQTEALLKGVVAEDASDLESAQAKFKKCGIARRLNNALEELQELGASNEAGKKALTAFLGGQDIEQFTGDAKRAAEAQAAAAEAQAAAAEAQVGPSTTSIELTSKDGNQEPEITGTGILMIPNDPTVDLRPFINEFYKGGNSGQKGLKEFITDKAGASGVTFVDRIKFPVSTHSIAKHFAGKPDDDLKTHQDLFAKAKGNFAIQLTNTEDGDEIQEPKYTITQSKNGNSTTCRLIGGTGQNGAHEGSALSHLLDQAIASCGGLKNVDIKAFKPENITGTEEAHAEILKLLKQRINDKSSGLNSMQQKQWDIRFERLSGKKQPMIESPGLSQTVRNWFGRSMESADELEAADQEFWGLDKDKSMTVNSFFSLIKGEEYDVFFKQIQSKKEAIRINGALETDEKKNVALDKLKEEVENLGTFKALPAEIQDKLKQTFDERLKDLFIELQKCRTPADVQRIKNIFTLASEIPKLKIRGSDLLVSDSNFGDYSRDQALELGKSVGSTPSWTSSEAQEISDNELAVKLNSLKEYPDAFKEAEKMIESRIAEREQMIEDNKVRALAEIETELKKHENLEDVLRIKDAFTLSVAADSIEQKKDGSFSFKGKNLPADQQELSGNIGRATTQVIKDGIIKLSKNLLSIKEDSGSLAKAEKMINDKIYQQAVETLSSDPTSKNQKLKLKAAGELHKLTQSGYRSPTVDPSQLQKAEYEMINLLNPAPAAASVSPPPVAAQNPSLMSGRQRPRELFGISGAQPGRTTGSHQLKSAASSETATQTLSRKGKS